MKVEVQEVSRADCRKMRFTGLRIDRILCNCEIWKEGNLEADISAAEMAISDATFKREYARIFGLHEDQVNFAIPRR